MTFVRAPRLPKLTPQRARGAHTRESELADRLEYGEVTQALLRQGADHLSHRSGCRTEVSHDPGKRHSVGHRSNSLIALCAEPNGGEMSIFGFYFFSGLMQEDSIILDHAIDQMIDWAAALGMADSRRAGRSITSGRTSFITGTKTAGQRERRAQCDLRCSRQAAGRAAGISVRAAKPGITASG